MTLVCRPVGRGNWHVILVTFSGPPDIVRLSRFYVGMRFTFGDPHMMLRIVEIRP